MASTPKGSMCLDQRFCSKAGSSASPSIQELVLDREETPSGLGIREVLALDQPWCPLMSNRHSQKRGVQNTSMERSERRRGTMCPMERASPRNGITKEWYLARDRATITFLHMLCLKQHRYTHTHGILFSHEKEGNPPTIFKNMDGTWGCYTKCIKSDKKREILYNITYM